MACPNYKNNQKAGLGHLGVKMDMEFGFKSSMKVKHLLTKCSFPYYTPGKGLLKYAYFFLIMYPKLTILDSYLVSRFSKGK